MFRKFISFMAAVGGFALVIYILNLYDPPIVQTSEGFLEKSLPYGFSLLGGTLAGFICYAVTPLCGTLYHRTMTLVDYRLRKVPTADIILSVFTLVVVLIVGVLLGFSVPPVVGVYISPIITLVLAVLGIRFVLNRKEDFSFVTSIMSKKSTINASLEKQVYKILDTSVIIDGRIVDICKTGFLEGIMVVPEFVLEELRHIADSPDLLKRNRGRRGLDILNSIQKEMNVPVEIYEGDFEDMTEVDSKLVRLAKIMNGKIITNDFNLNKVCELQGVPVLNINELANAVKPVVLPGEEMTAQIIKDGKEHGQGIAYLEDGTMIVVEGGKRHIGETLEVLVTSVLQTAAGRMIFAKPKSHADRYAGVR